MSTNTNIRFGLAGVLLLVCATAASGQATPDVPAAKAAASEWIDRQAETLQRVNRNIWSYAETGLEEVRSAGELIALLEANGFTVERGVAGMPTAFVATYGAGRPAIGILAEYDALPGLSQTASPEREEREGVSAGHGCGHSVFGTGSTAAAIGVKQAIEAGLVAGTVRLYGTPAEETGIGKTYMLRAGHFKDDDIVLAWHAGDRTRSSYEYTKAIVSVKFRFRGLPAHASRSPEEGRSALDAVELMNVGVNYMREHVRQDARIHYVITGGGGQPNVVPPDAEVWYYIRADSHADVVSYFDWVQEIARGAAMMTRTELAMVTIDSDMHEVLPNRTLSEVIQRNLEQVGPPRFTDAERAFARRTQEPLGQALDKALADDVEPLSDQPGRGPASTDIGDISWFVPVGQLNVASYTYGAPGHSWQIVACTGTSIGEKGMMVAAKAIAGTALELYASPDLRARARADLDALRASLEYRTLLPEGQRAPATVR